MERFNKKKSKDLIVNDLQHEITIVKQEMIDLKNEFKNIKQELIMLKIDKSLDHQQVDNMSTKIEKNPVNKPFFLKKVLLITLNLVLFTN